MGVDKIQFQFPGETIKYDNYHNVVIPNRGDYVKHNNKEYRVKYRIFDTKDGVVTVVLNELEESKY